MKYANVFDCFQTGDILLYEGAGLVSSLVKVSTLLRRLSAHVLTLGAVSFWQHIFSSGHGPQVAQQMD